MARNSPTSPDFGRPAEDALAARLFPPLPGTVKWGLERTARILAAAGDPHVSYATLHVGGTNGKGSVARLWAGVMRASGRRTGLYTSPHLVSFRERIVVDGRPVPDALLEACAAELRPSFEREGPSYFEAATALAFLAFARAGAEVVSVEVGLGGRLDATNVIRPLVTAVTNVALEHTEMLGRTTGEIAREKAGIFKAGVPAYTSSEDPEVLSVLSEAAETAGTRLRRVTSFEGRTTIDGISIRVETDRWGALDLASPLVGAHQLRNVTLAVRALEGVPDEFAPSAAAIREGVLRTRVPGRFQVERDDGQTWVLDSAHNPAGAQALASAIAATALPRPRVGLIGILADKDAAGILGTLAPALDRLVLTVPESAPAPRRWDPALGVRFVGGTGALVEPAFPHALVKAANLAGPRGTVVVAGSAHTVGDAMRHRGWIPAEALPASFESG